MASSRESILDSIRRNRPATAERPDLAREWTTYADPRAKFIEVLEFVGGRTIVARDVADLNEQLRQLPQVQTAKKLASLVSGVASVDVDLASIDSSHALADIDVAVLPGEFAVAENAAVWVTDHQVPLRVLFFLCQHLVLVVRGDAIVDHMHAAYDRLAVGPASQAGQGAQSPRPEVPLGSRRPPVFSDPGFGAFISGPSKTADIEQSLVIGAHGPRSLVVCFLEE